LPAAGIAAQYRWARPSIRRREIGGHPAVRLGSRPMNRPSLDAFAAQHRLSPAALDAALALTGLRPDVTAWRGFAARTLHAAGLGAVGAGALFFIAANWQALGLAGRFALLQAALLACIGIALWRPPAARAGQAALVLATLLTGGLLALFGQSYQTGADVHELFFTWALLALPFAIAGLSGALWAVWWVVLDIALALLCGWVGPEHFVWRLIGGGGLDRAALLMLPCLANLLGAGLFLALRTTRFAGAAPLWLVRLLAGLGFLGGTAASIAAVFGGRHADPPGPHNPWVMFGFAAVSAGIAFATWRRRRDVYPIALAASSWIAISTAWLGDAMRFNEAGGFFVIAAWLIGASTAAGLLLMHWVRAWRVAPSFAGRGAAA
jgi:Predicted membrane protein (DUF2157)